LVAALHPLTRRYAPTSPKGRGVFTCVRLLAEREPSSFAKIVFPVTGRTTMARKYSKKASADVERAMKKRKAGTLKSGRSGKTVKSRKQAIAIGLSEARAEAAKVPKKAAKKKKTAKKRKSKK
jgi:hypothetical protein